MTKLMQKRFKTSLTVSAVLMASFLAGCASKIDTISEQKAVNDFVAKANIASNVIVADETSWWTKLNPDAHLTTQDKEFDLLRTLLVLVKMLY